MVHTAQFSESLNVYLENAATFSLQKESVALWEEELISLLSSIPLLDQLSLSYMDELGVIDDEVIDLIVGIVQRAIQITALLGYVNECKALCARVFGLLEGNTTTNVSVFLLMQTQTICRYLHSMSEETDFCLTAQHFQCLEFMFVSILNFMAPMVTRASEVQELSRLEQLRQAVVSLAQGFASFGQECLFSVPEKQSKDLNRVARSCIYNVLKIAVRTLLIDASPASTMDTSNWLRIGLMCSEMALICPAKQQPDCFYMAYSCYKEAGAKKLESAAAVKNIPKKGLHESMDRSVSFKSLLFGEEQTESPELASAAFKGFTKMLRIAKTQFPIHSPDTADSLLLDLFEVGYTLFGPDSKSTAMLL